MVHFPDHILYPVLRLVVHCLLRLTICPLFRHEAAGPSLRQLNRGVWASFLPKMGVVEQAWHLSMRIKNETWKLNVCVSYIITNQWLYKVKVVLHKNKLFFCFSTKWWFFYVKLLHSTNYLEKHNFIKCCCHGKQNIGT